LSVERLSGIVRKALAWLFWFGPVVCTCQVIEYSFIDNDSEYTLY